MPHGTPPQPPPSRGGGVSFARRPRSFRPDLRRAGARVQGQIHHPTCTRPPGRFCSRFAAGVDWARSEGRDGHMQINAAVFRKVHEPLTIETVGHRQAAGPRGAGPHGRHRRLPQRSACRGWPRPLPARSPVRPRPRGRRDRRSGRRRRHRGAAGRPRRGLPVRLLRHLSAMPQRPPQCLHRRHRRARGERRRGCRRTASRSAVRRISAATPSTCCCTRTRWCGSIRTCRSIAPRWSAAAC